MGTRMGAAAALPMARRPASAGLRVNLYAVCNDLSSVLDVMMLSGPLLLLNPVFCATVNHLLLFDSNIAVTLRRDHMSHSMHV